MKKILSLAIIAALPFAANAANTTIEIDTPVPADEEAMVAGNIGPYQTAEIGEHDGEHIASTAYVKGAYNDAIAAINRIVLDTDTLQRNVANKRVEARDTWGSNHTAEVALINHQ